MEDDPREVILDPHELRKSAEQLVARSKLISEKAEELRLQSEQLREDITAHQRRLTREE